MLKRFRQVLNEYKSLMVTAQGQGVDIAEAISSGKHIYDYKYNKVKYLADNMKKSVNELRTIITNLYSQSSNPNMGEQYSKIMVNVRLLEEKYYDPKRSLPIVETIEKQLKPIEQDEFIRKEMEEIEKEKTANAQDNHEKNNKHDRQNIYPSLKDEGAGEKEQKISGQEPKAKEEKEGENREVPELNLPFLPEEIKNHVLEDIQELEKCYNASCFRSSVILCGRILETALHRKYFEVTGNDVLETNPGIGLGKLVAKLSERNVKMDPGLMNQIHLINNIRISSVHVKKDLFKPNQNQTQAIILYTLDALHKLFGNANHANEQNR